MVIGPSAETEFRGVFTQRQVNMFFLAELANGRRDSFETPLERDLDLFLGVGGSGRSPLNPPTRRSGGWSSEGKLIVGNYSLGGSEKGSGRWGLVGPSGPLTQAGSLKNQ